MERDRRLRDEQGGVIKTMFRQNMIPGLTTGLCDFSTPGAGTLCPQPRVSTPAFQGLLDDFVDRRVALIHIGPLSAGDEQAYPFGDFYNLLRMCKQMEGSTEIMKMVMAREILGK
jgi:hypothetical protein